MPCHRPSASPDHRRWLIACLFAVALGVSSMASALTSWTLASSTGVLTRALAIDSSGALYAGTVGSGVLRSTDASNWTAINTGMPYTEVRALLADGLTVYAGAAATAGGGVLKYTATANSWTAGTGLPALPVNKLARDSTGMLYATTNNGIYRSANNGSSWSGINNSIPNGNALIGLAVDSAGTLYASASSALIRSTDQGNTWATVLTPFTASGVFAIAVDSARVVYVGTSTQGVYKSADRGATWTAMNTGLTPTNSIYPSVNALAFDRYGTLFLGSNTGVYNYINGSWNAINSGIATNNAVFALAFDSSDNLYAGTSAGIYKSTNASTAPPAVTTPNVFTFVGKSDVALNSVVESAAITVSGINAAAPISITNGEYSINGGTYTSAAGTVLNGQTVKVRLTSSASFGTATTATLTIGGVSGSFIATTMSFTAVTSVTQVFTTLDTAVSVSGGVITISGAPLLPLVLTAAAPTDALVQLPSVKIQATTLSSTLSYEDKTAAKQGFAATDPAQLQIKQVSVQSSSQPAFEVARGTVTVTATTAGARIPLRIATATRGAMLRSLGAAKIDINRDSSRNSKGYVSEGKAALQVSSGNGFSASDEINIYAGETVEVANDGSLIQIRVGSIAGNQVQVGDSLSLTGVASGVKIANLSGALARFSDKKLETLVAEGVAKLYGGTPSATSFDSTTGVLSVTVNGVARRLVVVGDVRVDPSASANLFAAGSTSNGAYELSYSGLIFSVAGALGYLDDLTSTAVKLDASATLSMLNGGVIKATIGSVTYVAVPGNAVTTTTSATTIPGFETDSSGYPLFRDKTGAKQLLYPVLLDSATVQATFATADAGFTISYDGSGATTAVLLGKTYSIVPDYYIITAPPSHANDLYWIEGAKVYVRYPDGTAQGVMVK